MSIMSFDLPVINFTAVNDFDSDMKIKEERIENTDFEGTVPSNWQEMHASKSEDSSFQLGHIDPLDFPKNLYILPKIAPNHDFDEASSNIKIEEKERESNTSILPSSFGDSQPIKSEDSHFGKTDSQKFSSAPYILPGINVAPDDDFEEKVVNVKEEEIDMDCNDVISTHWQGIISTKFEDSNSQLGQIGPLENPTSFNLPEINTMSNTVNTEVAHDSSSVQTVAQPKVFTGEKKKENSLNQVISSEIQKDLEKESENTNNEITKLFSCQTCDYVTYYRSNFKIHLRIHTGEKPFQCPSCSAKFASKSNLARHLRSHTGEKPYKCGFCSGGFTQRSHLVRHTLIHTGEKPFKCDVCSAAFGSENVLVNHIRMHSGEKPYQCDICSVRFAHRSHLVDHIRTHTGEKPFTCDFCSTRFAQKSQLVCHIRTHTGEKPFHCKQCSAKFSSRRGLRSHSLTHKNEESVTV